MKAPEQVWLQLLHSSPQLKDLHDRAMSSLSLPTRAGLWSLWSTDLCLNRDLENFLQNLKRKRIKETVWICVITRIPIMLGHTFLHFAIFSANVSLSITMLGPCYASVCMTTVVYLFFNTVFKSYSLLTVITKY